INQTAEKLMGFENPIGQRIGNNVIVGVVKDFHYRPLQHPIEAMLLVNNPENIMTANIKIAPNNKAQTLTYIRDTYRKYRDERAFSYAFFDDMLAAKYSHETRLRNLMILFSVMAIIISVLGILGMSLFFIQRRTKEIGIRKINGATITEILSLLNKGFIKWVIIDFVIATPIAYYAMNRWLENFAYKTALSWWIFALAGVAALAIALFTVSWKSYRAASRNPVEALRCE
ncbi:MAG: ABC transporter permease, partial [Draconibacterium sp.]